MQVNARALSAYLARPARLVGGWMPLYGATFALQLLCGWLRSLAAALVLLVVNLLTVWILAWHLPIDPLALAIGFAPLLVSLATLVLPLGGRWFEQREGGRRPSARERAAFEAAFAQLQAKDPELRPPRHWFVTDETEPNACAYANALMLTRGLIDSPFLAAVLAHELGHLNSTDARVTAAVYRITTPPRHPVEFPFRTLAWLLSGRIALAPLRTLWAIYWRRREAAADAYAERLGQGEALAAYLDSYGLAGDLPTPFKAFGETSHPWTEHRIDDLEARERDD